MNPTAPRVLVIDDEAQIRRFLDIGLRAEGYQVLLAATGQEGLGLAVTQSPDVIVLDIGLPDLEGHDVLREIRQWSQVPVLMLSVRDAESEKVRALDAGANDYVTKPFDAGELAARLRALTRTFTPPAPAPVAIGDWELDPTQRSVRSVYGQTVSLTAKEGQLLAALAAEPDRVFTRDELLAACFHASEQPGVIDTYVHHLRRKISKAVIRTVHGLGYQIGEAHE
jgi:two-component system response regulator QseB